MHGARRRLCALLALAALLAETGETAAAPAPKAVRLEAIYTGDTGGVVVGHERGFVHLGTVELSAAANMKKLVGWPGATIFVHGLGAYGDRPSLLAGDVQVLDNIDARTIPWSLYQAWVEQVLFGERLSLLVGYYDLTSEFEVARSALFFIHSAHGTGTTLGNSGRNGPATFPVTSFGGRIKIVPIAPLYLQAALLGGNSGTVGGPDGAHFFGDGGSLLIGYEAGWLFGLVSSSELSIRGHIRGRVTPIYRAKVAVGGWVYPSGLARVDRDPNQPARYVHWGAGVYALGDVLVYREKPGSLQGLHLSGRVEVSRARVDAFPYFVGVTAAYHGPIPTRDADEVGFGVAIAIAGGPLRRARHAASRAISAAEVNFELSYRALLLSWLAAQADAQYIIAPNGDPSLPNALALLLRIQCFFSV